MPHKCTGCSRTFADGSKNMLEGCPNCGGNKFQFLPKGTEDVPPQDPPNRSEPAPMTKTAVKATHSFRELVRSTKQATLSDLTGRTYQSSESDGPSKTTKNEDTATSRWGSATDDGPPLQTTKPSNDKSTFLEDRAQADARSDVVSKDELPKTASRPLTDNESDEEKESLSLSELREELNNQFESIKIIDRGQYELNLMELYEREEYIISLQENGRYVIEVPESVYAAPSKDQPS